MLEVDINILQTLRQTNKKAFNCIDLETFLIYIKDCFSVSADDFQDVSVKQTIWNSQSDK